MTDIYELFFTDKQHQEENGMAVHIYQALREYISDVMETGAAKTWDLFESRMRGKPMNDMYGLLLPSQGWATPKLHSKVGLAIVIFTGRWYIWVNC